MKKKIKRKFNPPFLAGNLLKNKNQGIMKGSKFFCKYIWHSLLYMDFNGLNAPTSRGCVRWLVCGGSTKSTTLCFFAQSVKVKLI
jgi:hypothetical protein